MPDQLDIPTLLNTINQIETRNSTYWNFFGVVMLSAIGWLLSTKLSFELSQAVILTIGMLMFFFGNLFHICLTITELEQLEMELSRRVNSVKFENDALKDYLKMRPRNPVVKNRLLISFVGHLLLDVLVLCVIWGKYFCWI